MGFLPDIVVGHTVVAVADHTVAHTVEVVVARIAETVVGHTGWADRIAHILHIALVVEAEGTDSAPVPEGDKSLAEQGTVGEGTSSVGLELGDEDRSMGSRPK